MPIGFLNKAAVPMPSTAPGVLSVDPAYVTLIVRAVGALEKGILRIALLPLSATNRTPSDVTVTPLGDEKVTARPMPLLWPEAPLPAYVETTAVEITMRRILLFSVSATY